MPKEKRSKLDAFGKKGMFMGYSETSKAYRIYVPGQREEEICHDVTVEILCIWGSISCALAPKF